MSQERRCPRCGADLPANTPHGLCPACLLGQGIESQRPTEDSPSASQGSPATGGFTPPLPADLAPYFPNLEILELLGQGGMGAVYKARQKGLDRLVALKVLPPGIGYDAAFAERFKREARSLARLNHPNIVAVHDFGEAAGLFYFVMEYVDGVNLRQMERTERLAPREALGIVVQVCEALQFAHDEGIVHRDIKPENILLDKKGRVKIADFGLAKLLARAPADFTLTQPQQVMGTPSYMAPEQIEHPAEVDQRADIYSLGVVFYEMLTGELPLGRFAPPSQKYQVDVRLDEVVLKALEKEPSRRYQHASEVKTDVEEISRTPRRPAPAPVHTAAAPLPQGEAGPAARRRVRGPAIGLLVVGVLNCAAILPFLVLLVLCLRPSPEVTEESLTTIEKIGLTLVDMFRSGGWIVGAIAVGVAIALGVPILVGAVKMMRLRSSALVRTSAVLAMIPLPNPVTWLLGLPMGLWALVVLGREDVKAAFRAAKGRGAGEGAGVPQAATGDPTARLRWPAVGLLLAAIASLVASLVAIPGASGLGNVVHIGHGAIVLIFTGAVAYGVLLFVPAIALLGLRWRWVAVAGNIFAMLPISPAVVIGAPAAIWGLVALARPEVRAAFAAEAEKAAMEAPSRRQARRIGLALIAWLALGVGIGVAAPWLTGEYVPARYIVHDECYMDPIPASMRVPDTGANWSAHRGYFLECHATGEGRTWGRDPPNRGLERQRLVLRFLPPNSGPPSASRVLGQMEIDLRTLGYKYRGRDGVETAAGTGLDPKVILEWMKAGGAGTLAAGYPAELAKEAGPDGPRARSEAANLDELARNWRWLFPQEKIDRAIFVPLYGFQSQKTVDPDPWVEPAVWIILAAAWFALGALGLRRLRRPQAKVSLAVAGGRSAGGPAVTQESASKESPPPEQPGSAQGGLPPQAAPQRPGKGRRTRPAWLVAGILVGTLLVLLAVPIVGGLVAWRLVQIERAAEPPDATAVLPEPVERGIMFGYWGHYLGDGSSNPEWENVITKTGVEVDRAISSRTYDVPPPLVEEGSLKVVADGPKVVRLFETGPTADLFRRGPFDVDNSRLTYQAKLRTWALEGQAYLEMRCHFPGGEEFVSRGSDKPLSGTSDWTAVETSFVVKGAREPDNVQLNLVIDGKGTVWIDDVWLTLRPPSAKRGG